MKLHLAFLVFTLYSLSMQASYIKQSEKTVFFSEYYCGIIIDFDFKVEETRQMLIKILSLNINLPFQISFIHPIDSPKCPNFDIMPPPIKVDNLPYTKNINFTIHHAYFSIIIYTRFGNNLKSFESEISFTVDGKEQKFSIQKLLRENVLLELLDLTFPVNKAQGLKYHRFYDTDNLKRNLSFHKNPTLQVDIIAQERSGIYLLGHMIESLTKEWTVMFSNFEDKSYSFRRNGQLLKYSSNHSKVSLRLGTPSTRSNLLRTVYLIRDIVDQIESLFHKKYVGAVGDKVSGQYWLRPEYVEFYINQTTNTTKWGNHLILKSMQQKSYFVRYESILSDPNETMSNLLSFILGYSIQQTVYQSNVQVFLEHVGLVSYYKNLTINEAKNMPPSKTLKFLPISFVNNLLNSYHPYIYYFEFAEKYENFLAQYNKTMPSKNKVNGSYKIDNQKSLSNVINRYGYQKDASFK